MSPYLKKSLDRENFKNIFSKLLQRKKLVKFKISFRNSRIGEPSSIIPPLNFYQKDLSSSLSQFVPSSKLYFSCFASPIRTRSFDILKKHPRGIFSNFFEKIPRNEAINSRGEKRRRRRTTTTRRGGGGGGNLFEKGARNKYRLRVEIRGFPRELAWFRAERTPRDHAFHPSNALLT